MGRAELAVTGRSAAGYWKWLVCGLLLLASSVNYMDRMTLASVAPRLIEELHLSKAEYGTVEQYFGYAFAVGAILFGLLVDRVRVYWLYPMVLTAWSLMGILTGFAGADSPFPLGSALANLLMCRTLLGLFESGHWPCALQTTQRLLDPADRTLGNGILQSGTSVGAIVTPLIVAAMLTPAAGSWRGPFLWIGAGGLLWVGAWLWLMRGRDSATSFAPPPEKAGWASSLWPILTDHRFWLLALVVSCINASWSVYRVWLPLALQDRSGLAFTEAQALGRVLPLYYAASDAGCLAAGAATVWLHRRGRSVLNSRRWVFTLCGLLALPAIYLPALGRSEMSVPGLPAPQAVMLVLFLAGAGSLGAFPCYYAFSQELSTRHMGLVTGLLSFVAWVVPASLQKPLGAQIDRTGSFDLALQFGAWPVLIAAIALWLFWELGWVRTLPSRLARA